MKNEVQVVVKKENGIYITYRLFHNKNGYTNIYNIEAKICGLLDCKESALYITAISCESLTNNEETLMEEFAIELLENYIQN